MLGKETMAQQKKWTLKACIDQALEKNISLNESKLNNEINKISLSQAKANLYPNLNLSDGQGFNFGRSVDPFTYLFTNQSIATNNVALTSNVTLFNSFLNLNTVKQNELTYDAGKQDIEQAKNDISLNIAAAYVMVLSDYDAVDIAGAQVEATLAQVDRTQKYVDAGKLAESTLLQIQSQLASDRLTKVNAENQLQLDKVTLLQLMETPVTPDFEIERPQLNELTPVATPTTQIIYHTAESFLPQVKSAMLKTNASEVNLKIANAQQLPKLSLGGTLRTGYSSGRSLLSSSTLYQQQTIGFLQSNPSEMVTGLVPTTVLNRANYPFFQQFSDNFGQAISFTLTVPIFNNLQAKGNIEKAKVNVLLGKLNEQDVKNQVRKSVEQASTNLIAAEKKLAASQDQLTSEERTYKDLEKKFNLGLVNATDFLVEKNNLSKASLNLVQAKYDYLFKTKVVDFYLGKTLTL